MNVRLADIANILVGVPFRSRIESEAEGDIAVIQARDLCDDGRIDLAGAARIREFPAAGKSRLRPGDVVMQPRGARFSIGLFEEPDRPAVAAAPLLVIRCDETRIEPEFLVLYLKLPSTQAQLRQSAVGTYVPQVPREEVENLAIRIPALASQRRLVDLARLEQREAVLMDRLREQRERLFEIAVRQLGERGPQYPNAHPIQRRT